MRNFLTFILIFPFLVFSQAKIKLKECTEVKNANNESVKTCFHANGKISTLETWDKDKYWGRFQAFTNQGKEIINYQLRRVAGHASVYPSYYPNGQINKLEYSSAPDGGIQSYRYIHHFNEIGEQTDYRDYSMPNGYPTLITTLPDTVNRKLIKKDEVIVKKQEVVECSTLSVSEFVVINETKKKVKIKFIAQKNRLFSFSDKEVELKSKENLLVDKIALSNIFVDVNQAYKPELVGKNKDKFKVILAEKVEKNQVRTYTWHIIEK
jgi:hypothetical protein